MVRLYRTYFEARTSLSDMWRGNPVLTTVLFGLPLGFLSLILYSICCSDILDADEEEEGKQCKNLLFNRFYLIISINVQLKISLIFFL